MKIPMLQKWILITPLTNQTATLITQAKQNNIEAIIITHDGKID
jgi:hypothetical protein